MRILVVRLSSLGDIVMTMPCLAALRRHVPEGRIVMAVNAEYADLLAACPDIDGAVIRRQSGGVRRLKTLRQALLWSLGRTVRRADPFDLAIDLQGNVHSALWTTAARARVTCGLSSSRCLVHAGWSFVEPADTSVHAIDRAAAILERIGVPVTDRLPTLAVRRDHDRAAALILRRAGLPDSGYLVVHPGTAWGTKEWPLSRYREAIHRLTGPGGPLAGAFVAVTGSAHETSAVLALCRSVSHDRAIPLVGLPSLGISLGVWARARAFLGGDTGPLHASAALGVPVVALFGPTHPERSGPPAATRDGLRHRVIQFSRPDFHDAYRQPDSSHHMLAIPVEAVVESVARTWHDAASAPPARVRA